MARLHFFSSMSGEELLGLLADTAHLISRQREHSSQSTLEDSSESFHMRSTSPKKRVPLGQLNEARAAKRHAVKHGNERGSENALNVSLHFEQSLADKAFAIDALGYLRRGIERFGDDSPCMPGQNYFRPEKLKWSQSMHWLQNRGYFTLSNSHSPARVCACMCCFLHMLTLCERQIRLSRCVALQVAC